MKTYWQGEPCSYKVLTYLVTEIPEKPLHWQNRVAGSIRQGLEITYYGQTFILDNEDGQGWHKITVEMGSPTCGHRGVDSSTSVEYWPELTPNALNMPALLADKLAYDVWAQEVDPEQWAKLNSLRKSLEAHQRKYRL